MLNLFPSVPTIDPTKPYLWYADGPPALGHKPRQVSINEFMQLYEAKGGKPFTYTETVWSKLPKAFFSRIASSPNSVIDAAKQLLKNPNTDKFVIAFISPEVGFGVFARKKINRFEILSIYTGIIETTESSSTQGDYKFHLEHNLRINADNYGNISRLLQHLPTDRRRYLDFVHASQAEIYQEIKEKEGEPAMEHAKQKQEIQSLTSSAQDIGWELKSLSERTPSDILDTLAKCNAMVVKEYIGNYPVYVIEAVVDITPSDMIGIDYSSSYWHQALPKLFFPNGCLVPENQYKYDSVPLFYNSQNNTVCKTTYAKYKTFIDLQTPSHSAVPGQYISFFDIRDKLVANNVLSRSHAQLEHNVFASQLSALLRPCGIVVKCYYHDPEATQIIDQYNIDIVCQAPNQLVAKAFINIIDNECKALAKHCVHNTLKHEIIIRSVNIHTAEALSLILKLQRAHLLSF